MASSWQDISTRAKQKVLDDIPSEWKIPKDRFPADDVRDVTGIAASCGVLDSKEIEITEANAAVILEKVKGKEWKAEEVARAFCKRAAIAHQLTNCLTVIMFDDAIKRAKELDAEFEKTGKVTGPLHGLPVSLKDNFDIVGYPSSVGFCSWAEEIRKQDSTIVKTLRNLGAVAYVKTNVPTAMMIAETINNCYGRTINPLNRATTSGGSSGGESALIAFKGSPLGVGTDIGGSLRIPAACTGIYTLRPSYGRFPHFDARSGLAGQEAVASVHGPMGRSIADIRLFAEHVCNSQPWTQDPKCIPSLSWRPISLPSKPRIAVLWNNTMVTPQAPVTRALKETVSKLQSKGYDLIDWQPTDHKEAIDLLGAFFTADGGKSIEDILTPVGEPFRPEMKPYEDAEELGVHKLWKLQVQRVALQKRYLDRMADAGIDAILGPTTPYGGAPKNGDFKHVGYTGVFNILDLSSVSFPVPGCVVDGEKDGVAVKAEFGEEDEACQRTFDVGAQSGLPVSLQLTCRRLEEEKVLALTERLVGDLSQRRSDEVEKGGR